MTAARAGVLLVAHPELEDPNFRRSVVYLVEHNDEGSFGFVLNRPIELDVTDHLDLPLARIAEPSVFFVGGPVDDEAVVALGSDGTEPPRIVDIEAMLTGGIEPPRRLRFFAGYAGWAPGQLEMEIAADSWFVVPTLHRPDGDDDVFGRDPLGLWRAVLRRQPPPLNALALYPDDLSVN